MDVNVEMRLFRPLPVSVSRERGYEAGKLEFVLEPNEGEVVEIE